MFTKSGIYSMLAGAVMVAAAAMPSAARAQHVTTDYDHKANFEAYHTFSFYKVHTENPLFERRVRDEITRDLQAHGWQMVPSGGSVAITAVGNVQNQQEYTTFYNGLGGGFGYGGWGGPWGFGGWGGGFGGGFGGGPDVATTTQQTIPIGTLVVDMYDNNTHQLVFRGRATEELHVKHEDRNIGLVDKSIDKMFDHFPPKS